MLSATNALYVFLAWSGVQGALLLASMRSKQPLPELVAAVEKVEPSIEKGEKDEMAKAFLWISVLWFVVLTFIAAFAFHSAANGSNWGLGAFVVVGGWSLYDAASGPIVLGRMYPGTVGWQNWLSAVLSSAVWLLLFVVLAIQWLAT